jgi:hypothetical protein
LSGLEENADLDFAKATIYIFNNPPKKLVKMQRHRKSAAKRLNLYSVPEMNADLDFAK